MFKVAFDRNTGDFIYAPNRHSSSNLILIDNYEFDDTLEFMEKRQYQSSLRFVFKSISNGRKYSFGIQYLIEALCKGRVEPLGTSFTITGRFTFEQRGAYTVIRTLNDATN